MVDVLRKIRAGLVKTLEIAVICVVGILVLDVLWQVFTRKVLNDSSLWTDELATMLMIWVSLLGASIAFERKSHLGVDYFVNKLGDRPKAAVEIVVYVLVALFAGGILVFGGYKVVATALKFNQSSAALHIKQGYVYLALPISGFLILVVSLEMAIEKILTFGKKQEQT